MLNNLRAKMLSLQFRAIRRAVIVLIAKIPKDLERAITFGDALNHLIMISPFRLLFKFSIPSNIKVNVHCYERGQLGIVHCSRKTDYPRVVNLLIIPSTTTTASSTIESDNSSDRLWHYCTIVSLSRLYHGIARGHMAAISI